jgi:Protein of unknown function (DUF3667)
MTSPTAAPSECHNCGASTHSAYCGQCGQKAHTQRISFSYLLHEIPHAVFHVDRGLIPTVVGLFKRPGVVVDEYLHGKRARYFNPLTLLILCGGVCATLWLMFPFKPDVFWAGAPAAGKAQPHQLITFWFKVVGFTQLIWLPLMGWWLLQTDRSARQQNFLESMVAERQRALKVRVMPSDDTPPSRLKRLTYWLRAQWIRFWVTIRFWMPMTMERQAKLAVEALPAVRNYGECIVVAAFMTCASLLVSGVLSPALYAIDSPFYYRVGIAFAALASCIPVYHLLITSPPSVRPGPISALLAAAFFVVGTPYGFVLVAWGRQF